MKIGLMIVAAFFVGAGTGYFLCQGTIKRLRKRVKALRAGENLEEKKRAETMKKVVWVCLGNGIAWVWCSYVLAYMDKPQIAESLSQVAVTEIIGVVLAYAIKSAIENLSKHNRWPDKMDPNTPAEEPVEPTGEGS